MLSGAGEDKVLSQGPSEMNFFGGGNRGKGGLTSDSPRLSHLSILQDQNQKQVPRIGEPNDEYLYSRQPET